MAGRTSEPGASVLARAARLLGALPDDGSSARTPAVAAASGLPASTAHRLLAELAELGAVERTPDGWTLGVGLWELAEGAAVARRLRDAALPALTELYDRTGENAHVAVLRDRDVLYLAKATGPRAIPTLSRTGIRHPLHATGVGRAILAGQGDEWIDRYLAGPLERMTAHTITDVRRLRRDIAATRARGYALTRQEMTLGNVSIAIRLADRPGLPPAAIGIVSHLARADETRLVPLVRAAAALVDDDLDHRFPLSGTSR